MNQPLSKYVQIYIGGTSTIVHVNQVEFFAPWGRMGHYVRLKTGRDGYCFDVELKPKYQLYKDAK